MPTLEPFKLERFFAQYEFKVRYLLSASDCESLSQTELLALADDDARDRWERLRLGYTESQGDPALRAAIAAQYASVSPEDVLVVVPEEGIYLAMRVLLEPGQHVVAVQPAYQSLAEVARAQGCEVTPWPVRLSSAGNTWQLDLDELASLIRPETRLLVINFPHNPTGLVPSRAFLASVLALAREHDLYVFSDEMYRGLELETGARLPAAVDLYPKAISLAGLSKTHAVPGLRLGWLATHAAGVMNRLMAYHDYTIICHSAPSEVLGLMAVRATEQLLARNLALIRANAGRAAAFCARYPDRFRWLQPRGGSIAFPAYLGPGQVDAWCQRVLDQQGVLVVPANIFDYPGAHFRVGLGRANFAEAIARVEDSLAEG